MDYSEEIKKIKKSVALVLKFTGEKNSSGQEIFFPASGFVYKKKGCLITCNHVVVGATKMQIKFSDSPLAIDVIVESQDEVHDTAILKFNDDSREPLESTPSEVYEGMPVFFCGYPINLNIFTTHQGIISAIVPDPLGNKWYLIDGSNNAGNSGGPIFDKNGKVIGVMKAKYLDDGDSFLNGISQLPTGTLSLYGKDMMTIYKRLISNIQLGMGLATPIHYVKT
jgi:S1-C subfamily serine protease